MKGAASGSGTDEGGGCCAAPQADATISKNPAWERSMPPARPRFATPAMKLGALPLCQCNPSYGGAPVRFDTNSVSGGLFTCDLFR